jgi:serine phosphatase RsbU (regulator of sigma subunit)
MVAPRLEITASGSRQSAVHPLLTPNCRIGRYAGNDLQINLDTVSHHHAEVVSENGRFLLRDLGSRNGTFVNGRRIQECPLVHGDRISLGGHSAGQVVFLLDDTLSGTEPILGSLRSTTALLQGLRALDAAWVLGDVLDLVLDAAVTVSGADRGCIMLAEEGGGLRLKAARGWRGKPLPHDERTSRQIPARVFATGEPEFVDLDAPGPAPSETRRWGVRLAYCVPLHAAGLVEDRDRRPEQQRIGVLYLDSSTRQSSMSLKDTQEVVQTLAREAAIAIENARLYRASLEQLRTERELVIAAEIQQALLPVSSTSWGQFDIAARTVPCRFIGGDFYDLGPARDGSFRFTVGDVAGKGPSAALLSALVLGVLAAERRGSVPPATLLEYLNDALLHRAVEARFVTAVHGVLTGDGRLTYSNAGHNPPLLVRSNGWRRLDVGGCVLGLFGEPRFESETLVLAPGDRLVFFSDGVCEAENDAGEQFGESRVLDVTRDQVGAVSRSLIDALFEAARKFSGQAEQADDMTALVVTCR